jgi:hypothetical protein
MEVLTGGHHRPVTKHWQTLSHNVVHFALIKIRTHNISGDRHWSFVISWTVYLSRPSLAITWWPWSNDSWIYNYIYNQCLSPLMLWVRILISAKCTTLCDKVCQCFVTGRWCPPVNDCIFFHLLNDFILIRNNIRNPFDKMPIFGLVFNMSQPNICTIFVCLECTVPK